MAMRDVRELARVRARNLNQMKHPELIKQWHKMEVRLNDDKTIDEIVAEDVKWFHLEQMDDGAWWMGISRANGERLMVNLFTKCNAAITCNAESEDGIICEGFKK
jgi:hypothetical protein